MRPDLSGNGCYQAFVLCSRWRKSASVDAIFQNFAERARARMRMIMRMISWGIEGILASFMGVGASERRFALALTAMRRFFGSVQVLDRPVLGRPQRSPSPDSKASGPSNCLLEGLEALRSGL